MPTKIPNELAMSEFGRSFFFEDRRGYIRKKIAVLQHLKRMTPVYD